MKVKNTNILLIDDEWGKPGSSYARAKFEPLFEGEFRGITMDFSDAREGNNEYSVATALEAFDKKPDYSVILLDIMFGRKNNALGLEILREIRERDPLIPVIMFTSIDSDESIEPLREAMSAGASDYIQKNWSSRLCSGIVAAHLRSGNTERPVIIGNDPAIRDLRARIITAAYSNASVVITGESGTGKELVARAIHNFGPRRNGPFIAENVGFKDLSIIESELFGHAKGAFTGAGETRIGLLEAANGGTLFLDEFGTIPLPLQVRLLRALETRTISRLGETQTRAVDFQLICAANNSLESAIGAGTFREDLFYRVDEIRIDVPPLRERKDDIFLLSTFFLENLLINTHVQLFRQRTISPDAMGELKNYHWPGNIRQLKNVLHKACLFSSGTVIGKTDILKFLPPAPNNITASVVPANEQDWANQHKSILLKFLIEARKKCGSNAEFIKRIYPEAKNTDINRVVSYIFKSPYGIGSTPGNKYLQELKKEFLHYLSTKGT